MVFSLSPGTSTPKGKFKAFTQLPTELQVQIWSEAAKIPRFVKIGTAKVNQVPALLHVCRESRAAGLAVYSVLFLESHTHPEFHPPHPRSQRLWNLKPIYFNYKIDTLQFDCWPLHKCTRHWLCDAQDLGLVETLAVSKTLWLSTNRWVVWRDLPLFKSVRKLVLVVEGGENEVVADSDVVEWSFDGTVVALQSRRLRSAFVTEIDKMVSSGRRSTWRPEVTVMKSDGVSNYE